MASSYDEAMRLRLRDDVTNTDIASEPDARSGGAPSFTVLTKTVGTYPTTAAAYYACQTADVTGVETEGTVGTVTGRGDTLMALNLGTAIPPSGTKILITFVRWRWVFRYDA